MSSLLKIKQEAEKIRKMYEEDPRNATLYNKYWLSSETKKFISWFEDYYGSPNDYQLKDEYEIESYWVRRSFALMGWIAREKPESL